MISKIKIILFALAFTVTCLIEARTQEYKLVEESSASLFQLHESSTNEITFQSQWLKTHELDHNIKDLLNLADDDQDRAVLLASFNFYIPRSARSIGKAFFQNIRNLEQLSGMDYEKTSDVNKHVIKFKPHPFKTITSTSKMVFPANLTKYEETLQLRSLQGELLVHQTITNFSDYLNRSDIITLIQQEGEGSRITVFSLGILNQEESHSSLLGVTKKAMLSKMKDQMKATPKAFLN